MRRGANRWSVVSELETRYYEQDELWSHHAGDGDSAVMLQTIERIIPDDVRSVLDVGCGNGVISDRLAERFDVVGGDRSMAALRHVRSAAVQLSGDNLPFADSSFDLVLCTDVLEHLDDALEQRVIRELCRVSRRYVLICVPHAEPLPHFAITCPQCGSTFHAHHHQRSYVPERFLSVEGATVRRWTSFGARWPCVDAEAAASMRRITGASYRFPYPVCPTCGARPSPDEESPSQAMARRRFESYQYLLAEVELRRWPARSEIAVLLEVGVQGGRHPVPAFPVDQAPVAAGFRVRIRPERRSTVLLAFPDDWYWIEEVNRAVVVSPHLPSAVDVSGGEVHAVWAYDHVTASFLPATASSLDGTRFEVPVVSPDLYGYRIAIDCRDPYDVDVEFRPREPLATSAPSDVAFGTDVNERRLHQLGANLEATETSRAALQQMYEDTYERLQASAAAHSALNDLANSIEASRSHLESQLMSGSAALQSSWVAERRCKEAYEQISVLNRELIAVQAKLAEVEQRTGLSGAAGDEELSQRRTGKLRKRRLSRGT
jgi:SAM-dependent methyltransferase